MEKKSLLTANWLKAALLLMVMCFSGLYAQANTTNTVDLGEGNDGYIKPGQTYTSPAKTIATGRYFANSDGTITLTSSVNANTNLVPFTDNTYTDVIESVRDEAAKTKTFVFSAGNRGTTVYFKSVVSTTPYEVTFDYVRASNLEDYVESIVPEDGAVVKSLKDFTINFTTNIYGARNSAKLYKGETLVAEKALENMMNVNTYSFSFDQEITEPGDYTLVFPEESFVCSSFMKGSSEWKFSYTIEAGANYGALPISFTPAAGSTVDALDTVYVVFGESDYQEMEINTYNKAKVYNEAGELVTQGAYGFINGYYWGVNILLDDIIREPGTYTVKVAEGDIFDYQDHSKICPAFEVTYTIAGATPQPNMIISLVGGATAEEAVEFNNLNATAIFENTSATITSEWTDFGIFSIVPGSTIETCYVRYSAYKVSDTEYTLIPDADMFSNLKEGEAYKFKIPEGYFTYADGSKSPAYETWIKYVAPAFDPVVITVNPVGGTEESPVGLAPEEVNFTLNLSGADSVAISAAANNEDTAISLQIWVEWYQDWSNVIVYKPELVDGTNYKLVPFDEYYADNLTRLEAGKYRLHIPSGTFVYNGDLSNVNQSFDTYYTVILPDLTISPEPGTEIEVVDNEGLMYVMVRFNNETSVTPSNTVGGVLKKDGVVVEENVVGQKNWVQQSTVQYWFATNHIESGKYEFTIPGESVTLASGKAFEGVTVEYTVKGAAPASPYGVIFDPQGGATEEEAVDFYALSVKVSPKEGETITWFNRAWNCCFQAYDKEEQTWFNTALWAEFTDNGDGSYTLYNEFPEGNQIYRLYIPASEFYYNGDESNKNEEMILYYNLTNDPNAPAMIISPEKDSTVAMIDNDTFTVQFTGVESAEIASDATIAITNNGYIYSYLKAEAVEGEANMFRLVDTGLNSGNSFPLPIKAAGSYGIYIAPGSFLVDGSYNTQVWEEPYIYVDGSMDMSPSMEVTPAQGSKVTKIDDDTFILEITGAQNVTINSVFDTDPAARYIGVTSGSSFVHLLKPVAIEGETNKFRLVSCEDQSAVAAYMEFPITEEGTYGLFVKAGSFITDGVDYPNGTNYWNQSQLQVAKATQMIVTPANGSKIDSYNDIQIKFEGCSTVEINPNTLKADFGKMMLVADDNWEKSVVVKPVLTAAYTYGIEIIDGQLPDTYTSLMFFMEEGSFFMDGEDSPGIEYYYSIAAQGEPKMVVTPAAGTTVKALTSDVITISFENVSEVKINDYALIEDYCKISIIKPNGTYYRAMPQAIEGETNKFRLVNFDGSAINLTDEGKYGLWINGFPQPAFYMDGAAAPEFYEAALVTVAPYTYVAEPAEGIVASIDAIALSFDPSIVGMNKDATGAVLLVKDGVEVAKVSVEDLAIIGWGAVSSQTLAIQFAETFTESGNYKVVIPEGVVELEGGIVNKEITLNYAITGVSSDWTAVADPTPGVVEELTTIKVTFEGASSLSVAPDAGPNDFPYYATVAEDGTMTKVPYSIFSFPEGDNRLTLSIQNENAKISEPGAYAIIIPAGYCLVDGAAMTEDIRFDYTIEGAEPEYTVIMNPADGASVNGEQLYEITVTFDGAKAIELNGDQTTTFQQLDENGNPVATIYQTNNVEGNVAKFTVMELHKPYLDPAGTFRFSIPVGMVTITDNNGVVGKNKQNIVATYYSNGVGVDTIGVDAKNLNIYTVSGMLIKRNGTYEDVKALESGIYIINGKKFYVK